MWSRFTDVDFAKQKTRVGGSIFAFSKYMPSPIPPPYKKLKRNWREAIVPHHPESFLVLSLVSWAYTGYPLIVMYINLRKAKVVAVCIMLAALGVALSTFLLPVAETVDNATAAHLRTAMAALAAALTTGAAFWFLRGLTSFKAQSRHAYVLISIGLVVFSIALLQVPIIGLFDLWKSAWTTSGAAIVPFVVPLLLVYLGLRKFTKLLQ